MKKINASILTLLAALALPLTVQAEPGAKRGPDGAKPNFQKLLQHLDADGDGQISKAEAEAAKRGRLAKHFDRIDADGDGFLTREELAGLRKKLKAKADEMRGKWKELDSDGSGGLSYEEVEASGREGVLRAFAMIDTDDDGELSPKELRQAKQKKKKGKGPQQ
ncbi:MAG: EF-hand domain-containing protein [Verrucomicrobiota bacterium]